MPGIMMVWIALALLTGAAVMAVLLPLAQARDAGVEADDRTDAAFYKAQLREIARDAERGLIDPQEAEVARLEAARLLLAADRRAQADRAEAGSTGRRRAVALACIVLVPALSLGLYMRIGQPDLPGQPLAARSQDAPVADEMATILAKIEAHLAANPNDGEGYELVAPVYLQAGRIEDAVKAYDAAIRLRGESAKRLENKAEALIYGSNGIVSVEARAALDRALALDPKTAKGRYYRAVAAEQDGDKALAITILSGLVPDLPPGMPMVARLVTKIEELSGKAPATEDAPAGGEALMAMPAADRMAAIRTMVASLAERLATDGRDVEGWLRLIRSYVVLGEPDKAREALGRARTVLDGEARGRVEALARELNIGGS